MFKVTNDKKLNILNTSFIGVMMKNIFLVFFLFAFSIQQLYAFSFLNKTSSGNKSLSELRDLKSSSRNHIAEFTPDNHVLLSLLAEESEDDDEESGELNFYNNLNNKFADDNHLYGKILRSRYLQFASSVSKQKEIPYFILYQCWKLHIV